MLWFVIGILMIAIFITVDTIKGIKNRHVHVGPSTVVRVESEMIKKVEAEVEAKMNEINRHQSERKLRSQPLPVPAAPSALPSQRDPMNDTRCMAAVKEKVEEIERLAEEKGISKD